MVLAVAKQRRRRARNAGLRYVNSFETGITRRRCGRGFTFLLPSGQTVKSNKIRRRIQSLVIPPAWDDVWICRHPNGHIQVRGQDAAGRTQYIYHPKWTAVSNETKFDRMIGFAELLPRIRRRVRKDLSGNKLTEQRVLACVVRLLDKSHLRIGNRRHLEVRDSRGATTLDSSHVDVGGPKVALDFIGKSGKRREIEFSDAKVAKVIRQCEEIDGQFLFSYQQNGTLTSVTSSEVNQYLREIAKHRISAKDFRTWWGSVVAFENLTHLTADMSTTEVKKSLVVSVKAAAAELGNTAAVCKSSYIHPGLLAAAQSGELPKLLKQLETLDGNYYELTEAEAGFSLLLPELP